MSGIQPSADGPSAEQCFYTWKAERDQLEAIYHDLTRRLDRWRADQESQIHMECNNRLRDIPADSRVVHIMRNHIEDERKARLKKLQRDYQANKDEQDEGHARELQAHTESFVKRVDSAMARVAPQNVQPAAALDTRNRHSMGAMPNHQPISNQATNHPDHSAILPHGTVRHGPMQAAYSLPSQTRGPAQAQPPQPAFPTRAHVPTPELEPFQTKTHIPTDTRKPDFGHPETVQASQSQQWGDQREVAMRTQVNRAPPHSPPRPSGQATPDHSANTAPPQPEQPRLFAAVPCVSSSQPSLVAAAPPPPVVLASQQRPSPSPPSPPYPRAPPAHGHEHEEDTLKRKAETQPILAGQVESKKAKLAPTSAEQANDRDGESPPVAQPLPETQKTISFDEVYQNGAPEHQAYHMMIEYPVGKGNWYILKCDEHGVYFNANPLHGAAKHLHSPQHDMMSKEHSQAIAVLGYLVLDCNAELAAKNNAVVKRHFEEGHKPFNQNQLTKTERVRRGLEPPGNVRPASSLRAINTETARLGPGRTARAFSGITHPVPAELYLGYWSKNRTNYGVLVLPWDDLGPCGLSGHLKYTGLLSRVPKCYRITEDGDIAGWAEGYEDDGPLVTKRDFPVMYFDGGRSVGWLRARDLSSFPFEGGTPKEIPYYHEAKEAYAKAKGFESYEAYKTKRRLDGLPEKVASDVAPSSSTVVQTTEPSSTVYRSIDSSIEEDQAVINSQPPGQEQAGPPSTDLATGDRAVGEGPHDEHMSDVSPGGDDSVSNHYSDAQALSESDEDIDMHGGDSRRTSVSHKDSERGSERAKSGVKKSGTVSEVPGSASSDALEANMTTGQLSAEVEAAAPGKVLPQSNGQAQDTAAPLVAADVPGDNSAIAQTDLNHSPQPTSQKIEEQPGLLSGIGFTRADKAPGRSTRNTRASVGEVSRTRSPSTGDTVIAKPRPRVDKFVNETPTTSPRPARKGRPLNTSLEDSMSSPPTSSSIEVITGDPEPLRAGSSKSNGSPDHTDHEKEGAADAASQLAMMLKNDVTTTRSSSYSPVAGVSGPASGTSSTPTIIRPEAMAQTDRWRAVRSESTNRESSLGRSVASKITDKEASRSPSVKPSKESSAPPVGDSISVASTLSTPLLSAGSIPKSAGNEERYEIAWYENSDGLAFQRKEDGPCLYLETNSQTRAVESSPGQDMQLKIDPTSIDTMVVEPLDEAMDAVLVTLSRKTGAGGPKEEKLVFERSSIRGDDLIGRIHARYFVSWVNRHKAPGQAIKYINNSHDPLRRPVTSYVPRSSTSKAKRTP